MQSVHAEDDLFEGARRDGADKNGSAVLQAFSAGTESRPPADPSGQPCDRKKGRLTPPAANGALKRLHVIAPLG